jgi:hypothetical protein
LGGASGVITGDNKEEVLIKAKRWYEDASKQGLYPRDDYIYGHADMPVTYYSSIEHKQDTAHVILVDMQTAEKPKNAESELPFPMFTKDLSPEEKKKRWLCFVSAHT